MTTSSPKSKYEGPERRASAAAYHRAMWFIITAIVAVQGWMCITIIDFYGWKRETSGNRFTAADGAALLRSHNQDITLIRSELAAIRELIVQLPREGPPVWFLQSHERLEKRVERLEDSAYNHKGRITK